MQYWTVHICLNFDLINYVEERPSWELTVRKLIKKLPSLCGSQIYCTVYKILLLVLVLSQVISVHVLPPYILTSFLILYHPSLHDQVSRVVTFLHLFQTEPSLHISSSGLLHVWHILPYWYSASNMFVFMFRNKQLHAEATHLAFDMLPIIGWFWVPQSNKLLHCSSLLVGDFIRR